MSAILYYSNFCNYCKTMLQKLSKTSLKDEFHFVCIDKRRKDGNKIYVVLENGQELLLPEKVAKVPALLKLNDYSVIFGEDIYNYFQPKQEALVKEATMDNMEPMAYTLGGGGGGIFSDQFSFYDMDHSDLSAKGEGGTRQMYNYVSLNQQDTIYTPEENQKISNDMTVEKIQKIRENEISR